MDSNSQSAWPAKMAPSQVRSKPLLILSLDGGGVKGYTSLLILKRIFRQIGDQHPEKREPKPCEIFDLIVGTSTGGLIAIMLGRLHMSIDECLAQYEKVSKKIFGKPQIGGSSGRLLKAATNSPFYSRDTLQQAIRDVLNEAKVPVDTSFCEEDPVDTKVVESKKPDVLRSYKTAAPSEENYSCRIWEAASATAAAPFYFEHVKFEMSGEEWCDGGLRRNNPVEEALAEVCRHGEFRGRRIRCLLSIGTGFKKVSGLSPNPVGFHKQAVEMMTDSEGIAEQFASSPAGRELQNRNAYFRFSVPQGLEDLELDEYKATERMKAMTRDYLRTWQCAKAVDDCATVLSSPGDSLSHLTDGSKSILSIPRCIHFINRPRYADAMKDFFTSDAKSRRYVLCGMSGSGKTQIAANYARSRAESDVVFWVRSDQYSNFVVDFTSILRKLRPEIDVSNLSEQDTTVLSEAQKALQNCDRCLVVLDNADNFDEFVGKGSHSMDLREYLPENVDILLTTRDPRFFGAISPASSGSRVVSMEYDEAVELLKTSLPSDLWVGIGQGNDEHVRELLQELGNLPLGIAQAAANIRERQVTLSQYNKMYRDIRDRTALMEEPVRDILAASSTERPQSILITWELTFERLESKYPDSLYSLYVMSMFHWKCIPTYFLRQFDRLKQMSPIGLENVLKQLKHLSLVDASIDGDWCSLHPLLHERVFERLAQQDAPLMSDLLFTALAFIADSSQLMDVPTEDKSASQKDLDFGSVLVPHGLRQLEIVEHLGHRSEPAAMVMQYLSQYFRKVYQTSLAVSLSREAVEMVAHLEKPSDLCRLKIRYHYIEALIQNNEYHEAKRESLKLLETMERLESSSSQDSCDEYAKRRTPMCISCQLLEIMARLEDYSGISEHVPRLIGLVAKLTNDHGDLFHLRNCLAFALAKQGRLEDAAKVCEDLIRDSSANIAWEWNNMVWFDDMRLTQGKIFKCYSDAAKSREEKERYDKEALAIFLELWESCITWTGIKSMETWVRANNFLETVINIKSPSHLPQAMEVVRRMLRATLDSDLSAQGEILGKMRVFVANYFILDDAALDYGDNLFRVCSECGGLYADMLEALGLDTDDLVKEEPRIAAALGIFPVYRINFT